MREPKIRRPGNGVVVAHLPASPAPRRLSWESLPRLLDCVSDYWPMQYWSDWLTLHGPHDDDGVDSRVNCYWDHDTTEHHHLMLKLILRATLLEFARDECWFGLAAAVAVVAVVAAVVVAAVAGAVTKILATKHFDEGQQYH